MNESRPQSMVLRDYQFHRSIILFSMIHLTLGLRLSIPFLTKHRVKHLLTKTSQNLRGFSILSPKRRTLADDDSEISAKEIQYHLPVMLNECCDHLMPSSNGNQSSCTDRIFLDCTLGGGGHTQEILRRGGKVIALDQDPEAIKEASRKLNEYLESGKLEIIPRNFRHIRSVVEGSKLADGRPVDGILMDLGMSSHQIDDPLRGFAFGSDGPLDMRMNKPIDTADETARASKALTAADIVNNWDATSLANLLFELGEEPRSRVLAREIIAARPYNTTKELASVISKATYYKHQTKTLARCFQALRIAVNDEMRALDEALEDIKYCLKPGGRLVVLSYHSLEDRKVKRLFKTGSVNILGEAVDPADDFSVSAGVPISPWICPIKGAMTPSEQEIERNRRSRSAKLRVGELLDLNAIKEQRGSSSKQFESASRSKYKAGMIGEKQRRKRSID